mmetsp:Transcript_51457/g.104727  ORF Transcript_51457/g.104727 Transcript_51457/m.104727 type:complete len:109 (+) Transcript_51457:799-1125(+)
MQMSTGKTSLSVRDIVAQTNKMLIPLAANFADVESFIQYLVACVGAEVIHRKAQVQNADGRAYLEAEKWLINLRHELILIMPESIETAIRIAQDHSRQADPPPVKTMV